MAVHTWLSTLQSCVSFPEIASAASHPFHPSTSLSSYVAKANHALDQLSDGFLDTFMGTPTPRPSTSDLSFSGASRPSFTSDAADSMATSTWTGLFHELAYVEQVVVTAEGLRLQLPKCNGIWEKLLRSCFTGAAGSAHAHVSDGEEESGVVGSCINVHDRVERWVEGWIWVGWCGVGWGGRG